MSRIGERLQSLHKPSTPMGFGFASASFPRRQMLLLLYLDSLPGEDDLSSLAACIDVCIMAHGEGDSTSLLQRLNERAKAIPVGAYIAGAVTSVPSTTVVPDFVLCDLNGPADACSDKHRGLLIEVECDLEANRLRAVGELGPDAVVLDVRTMDLGKLLSIVECRRTRAACGKPLVLHIGSVVTPEVLDALWQAGVDGLMMNSSTGVETLLSIRAALDAAKFQPRSGSRGGVASIGPYVSAVSHAETDDDEEGGEEEEDDDDV